MPAPRADLVSTSARAEVFVRGVQGVAAQRTVLPAAVVGAILHLPVGRHDRMSTAKELREKEKEFSSVTVRLRGELTRRAEHLGCVDEVKKKAAIRTARSASHTVTAGGITRAHAPFSPRALHSLARDTLLRQLEEGHVTVTAV